jgi:competence protein ComEA
MPRRLAVAIVLALCLLPVARRWWARGRPLPPPCAPAGRGEPPRHWLGCEADPGPPRALADEERLALGLPIDPNRAGAVSLACVPGIGPGLAAEVVADRERRGPFSSVDDLARVRGIGPRRLERARAWLAVPTPPSMAPGADKR